MRKVMIAAIAACCVGAVAAVSACSSGEARTDYCAYGDESTLLVIDRTTPYDETDRRVLLESAGATIDRLGVGDRVVVVTIGSHYSMSNNVFSGCRPGCPEATSPLGDLAGSCSAVIARRDERDFRARLIAALRPLMSNVQDDSGSDITGTLAQVTRRPPEGRSYAAISIYSDMLENSQPLPWRTFAGQSEDASLAIARQFELIPNVNGATVRIVGFGRLHDAQRSPLPPEMDQRIRRFWQGYFRAGGAGDVSFETSLAN